MKTQKEQDDEYTNAYRVWVSGLSSKERAELEKQGIEKPDTSRKVVHGYGETFDDAVYVRREISFEEVETPSANAIDPRTVIRMALADILIPKKGCSIERQLETYAIAVGMPGMGSISSVARKHGVGKAAISKACVAICKEAGLPPSPYMATEASREKHKMTNRRKTKRA